MTKEKIERTVDPKAMTHSRGGRILLKEEEAVVFRQWLTILNETGVKYVVAGAFALHAYTSIWRWTKDLDIFLKAEDLKTALTALSDAGFETEVRDPHWLAKARQRPYLLDLIFSLSTNTVAITDEWLERSVSRDILDVKTQVIGREELIASKSYVVRSDRFDGADIAHIIRCAEGQLDWDRLIRLLGGDRLILFWYLVLFSYIYPGHSDYLPKQLMADMFEELKSGWSRPASDKSFRGMILDPLRFAVDIEDWGYERPSPWKPLVNDQGEKV